MIDLYQRAKREVNYDGVVSPDGSDGRRVKAARQLVMSGSPAVGFTTLWNCTARSHVEYQILRPSGAL